MVAATSEFVLPPRARREGSERMSRHQWREANARSPEKHGAYVLSSQADAEMCKRSEESDIL
jgi:hypothetical protein